MKRAMCSLLLFSEPDIYPIELYYLMDVSYSMREDMKTMKEIGSMMADKVFSQMYSKCTL